MKKQIKFVLILIFLNFFSLPFIIPMLNTTCDDDAIITDVNSGSKSSSSCNETNQNSKKRKRQDTASSSSSSTNEIPSEKPVSKLSLADAIKKFFGINKNIPQKSSIDTSDDVEDTETKHVEQTSSTSTTSSKSSTEPSATLDEQIQFSRFNIFIEFDPHNPPVEAFGLRVAIEQEAAPCLVFQKHLLIDALKFSRTNMALKGFQILEKGFRSTLNFSSIFSNWIILELSYENLEGFLLIPKKYVQKLFPQQALDQVDLKAILDKIGISTTNMNINNMNTNDEILEEQEKIDVKIIKQYKDINTTLNMKIQMRNKGLTTSYPIDEDCFSSELSNLFPKLIEKIFPEKNSLDNTSHNYIFYIVGHGQNFSKQKDGDKNKYIISLTSDNTLELLSILKSIGTKIVYLATCFLGKDNIVEIEESLNNEEQMNLYLGRKEQLNNSEMIVITGATTQILTTQLPRSFINFFDACETYLKKETYQHLSEEETYKYFATYITPHVCQPYRILEQFGLVNGQTTIPQIKLPGNESKFHSLAPDIIDLETLKQAQKNNILNFNDAKLIYIEDVTQIDIPVELNQIPALILGNHKSNVYFKKIEIKRPVYAQITEPEIVFASNPSAIDYNGCDFWEFVMNAFIARNITHFFAGYIHTDIFEIKELDLRKKSTIKILDKNIELPATLYNIFVKRKEYYCSISFNLDDKISKDKFYKCIISKIPKQKKLNIKFSEVNSKDELRNRLKILYNEKHFTQYNALLTETSKIYPDVSNSFKFSSNTK